MTRIIIGTRRYKRLSRERRPNPAALAMPAIVAAKEPKPRKPSDPPIRHTSDAAPSSDATAPANDDCRSVIIATKPGKLTPVPARPSAIVTARKPGKRYADVPEMTPDEHKRRGDAADALFREMKRRVAAAEDKP